MTSDLSSVVDTSGMSHIEGGVVEDVVLLLDESLDLRSWSDFFSDGLSLEIK